MADRPNTHADRQRLYRKRQRDRLAVYRVPAGDDLLLALLTSGRLTEAQALDRHRVEQEVAAVLAEWARLWAE
ncbi:hypothetical protein [Sphingomonas sp. CFBP 8764]|uniref:hypothetical protein n=1 Tax=Sphingomonas sp. CFBP 8764 TaxID=2775275 RepID=UPI00177CCE0A|nr:hypothetical protein [Sphingomonas sp. CFBP 8764]MBD8552449.1 hypothetical protein [Sphingomonas sp. CFBP 8764]